MGDFVISSSTGAAFTPNQPSAGSNLVDSNVGWVPRLIPGGALLSTRGLGQFDISHIGLRGSLTVEVVLGAAGSARGLLKLASALTSPTYSVALSLDASNRPVATIVSGTTTTASSPSGAALAAGAQLQVQLVWDSVQPLPSGNYVDFRLLSGAAPGGTTGTLPAASFAMGPMIAALAGYDTSVSDFNGTVLSLQVGDKRF